MLLNMKSNNKVGKAITETASIAYTGELLPVGTFQYPNTPDIINTSFDSSAGWVVNAGWSVSGGKANVNNSGVASYLTFSSFSPTIGKSYEVTFTVSDYVAGTSRFTCAMVNGQAITANGTYTETFVALSAVQFSLYGGTTAVCSFDNLTVKEVLINPNLRYLKNSGKDKTPALVESGQGKFFNGTSQYINTGIIPNKAEGTLVTRFTYVTGMVDRSPLGSNGVNSRIAITVNTSGKIAIAFGDTSSAILYIPDVLISGKSYHVAFMWSGLSYRVLVNGVLKLNGTISIMNAPTQLMYVGAFNSVGTPLLYFNNVIDETYYYDVALTDAQIEMLYKYPEKVKKIPDEVDPTHYRIVPDIGSEANCKLFLPMCENSGSNVVNVAVARSVEIGITSEAPISATYVGGVLTPTSSINGRLEIRPVMTNIVTGDAIEFEVNMVTVNAGTKIKLATNAGGWAEIAIANAVVGSNKVIGIVPAGSTVVYALVYSDMTNGTATCTIGSYTVKEITAYPLVNYTTAMHTSAAKLPYGAQCTAWKRDSLGVLLGMSNGLSFDGGVSVNKVNTAWIPLSTESFVVEAVIYSKSGLAVNQNLGAKNFRWNINTTGNGFGLYASSWRTTLTVVANQWHHVVVEVNGTTVKRYVDGVLLETLTGVTWTSDITAYFIGDDGFGGVAFRTIVGAPKIHKGAEYAKFNIAKAWANAQKIITKLGA